MLHGSALQLYAAGCTEAYEQTKPTDNRKDSYSHSYYNKDSYPDHSLSEIKGIARRRVLYGTAPQLYEASCMKANEQTKSPVNRKVFFLDRARFTSSGVLYGSAPQLHAAGCTEANEQIKSITRRLLLQHFHSSNHSLVAGDQLQGDRHDVEALPDKDGTHCEPVGAFYYANYDVYVHDAFVFSPLATTKFSVTTRT